MRLKKIAILGFKSFADKTVLHFDAGISCIVGPNGCGKSNIADAFRWVLGEQSAKSLRGAKMPDVIFAGTTHRKPLNFAEVSLTLTDVQGTLQIDYEEVTLTRRLHRSGESEYFINGNPVRLKDVQTLFLDSGVGRNAFSIFEQGKLDQVISFSPIERRYIFEEAAGILRFLQRKKEALKRLEQADLNLSRVLDIHGEVEKQIQTLESQAKKARIYKENKASLEVLEKASLVLRWQGLQKKCGDLHLKQGQQQKRLEVFHEQGAVLQTENQEAKQTVHQHDKALRAQSEKVLTMRGQQEMQQRECQSSQQRIKEAQQRERKFKQELEDLALARQTRQKMLSEIGAKRQQLESEWSDAESKWMQQQDRVKLKEKEVSRLRQELVVKQQVHLKAVHRNSQCESDVKQSEVRLENLVERQRLNEIRGQQLSADQHQLVQSLGERKQHLQEISEKVDGHKDRLEGYEEELHKLAQEGEAKHRELDAIRRKVMEGKARQKVLLKMREEHEGFSSGGKRLLQESGNADSPLYNTLRPLYEFFQSDAEAAEALAVVLRTYAQTLIVETEKEFSKVIAFAEEAGLQDYSLLCLEWLQGAKVPNGVSVKQSLIGKVTSNPLAIHFLESVAVGSTREEILKTWIEGKCTEGWSLQGVYIDHRGVLFKMKPNENQVFLRETELKNLEEELVGGEDQLSKLEQALQGIQQRRSQLQLERGELDKMLRRDEMRLVEVNVGLQRALADVEKNKKEQAACEQDLAAIKQQREEHGQAYQILAVQLEQARRELLQLQEEKEVLEEELAKQDNDLRMQQQEQKEKGSVYQQLAEDRQQMLHQYNLLEVKEQDYDRQVQRIHDEIAELEESRQKYTQDEKEALERLASIENGLKEASALYVDMEAEAEGLAQQLHHVEMRYGKHLEELKQKENEAIQLQMQIEHQKEVMEAVAGELEEKHHLSMEDALALSLPLDRSLEQTEKEMRGLRHQLQEAGDVNLTAIEDLEKHQVRYVFLKKQMEDMQQSKSELLGIIGQLDGESRKLFKETFEAIRANFKKNFQILFSGGEADLQFTETEDVLAAGIEIIAKPPGKQMRSISLLSGGEKCLTAVALLFAIFEVKPAPFCILDEIDAPLDDTNVERFVNVVKHFVDRCQFLIITHNKRTMAIGDVIFGVSMEERGVSKLLSLEFAHRSVPEASLV